MDVCSGEGWQLRVDPRRSSFPVLIGGRDWAAELTADEARLLRKGVETLLRQLTDTAPLLMPEESLELEHSSEGLWLQLSGRLDQWSLRFLIDNTSCGCTCSRGLEGAWDCLAGPAFVAALAVMQLPEDLLNPT